MQSIRKMYLLRLKKNTNIKINGYQITRQDQTAAKMGMYSLYFWSNVRNILKIFSKHTCV